MLEGPDGAVYMIDWYDKNECHHNDPNGHDQSNGRIFRISYGDVKFPKVDLQKLHDADLVSLLTSENRWHAGHARRILQERYAPHFVSATGPVYTVRVSTGARDSALENVTESLERILSSPGKISQKLRALWTLHAIHLVDDDRFLQAEQEDLRAWGIQLMTEDNAVSSKALKEFVRLAREDSSPVVRRYLASAMQRLPIQDRWDVIEALSQRAEDANDHNLPLMVWYAAEPLTTIDTERALKLAENSKLPKLLNFTVRRTAALNTPEAFAAITRSLQRMNDDPRRLDILSGLSLALKGQRQAAMPTGWAEVEARLSSSPNAEIRGLVQSLSLTFGSAKALAALKATLMDTTAAASTRRMAFDSLQAARDASLPALVLQLLSDSVLQSAALRGLASYDEPKTPDSILAIYSSLGSTAKRDALNTLASRAAYAQKLLTAVDAGKIPRTDLTADLVQQLRNLKNAEVDALLTKVWGVARDSVGDKLADIERYKQIYRAGGSQPGDAMRGRAIYAKVCYQCHTLFGTGGKVGPDLTGSNRGDLDYILQNIVDPNAVIPNEYVGWNIDTKDDRVITGLIKEQNDSSVTVATANETITIPRNEIATMQQGQLSMMPEGLMLPLAEQEVRDLIYYLRQPGQVPLLATPDTVNLFFNEKDLSNWDGDLTLWSVENGEIVGKTTTGLKHNEFLKSQFVLSDFRLTFQVKLAPNTENSGVQFRSEPFEEYEMKGCQADIGRGWWGKVYEENGRALLSKVNGDAFVKENDWNTYEILAVGSKIRTAINGNLCTDLDDPLVARRGIVGLQVHSGGPTEVRFRSFQLELNPKFELTTAKP
jgi:putative heme-binding domain-containing protein